MWVNRRYVAFFLLYFFFSLSLGLAFQFCQRQCLTVDRDAPPGDRLEIWSTDLSDGSTVVLLANKGPVPAVMTVSWQLFGWDASRRFAVRDLWEHSDWKMPARSQLSETVKAHDAVVLKLTPVNSL